MGIFTRFTDIVNANLNNMLDKAENPEKMIKMIIQEMEETLVEVRSTAARSIAEKKTILREVRLLEASIEQWQQKAELALSKNREDLARAALTEKQNAQAKINGVQEDLQQLDENLNAIQADSQRLQTKLSEAKRKQEAYTLRQQSAQVRLKVRTKAQIHNIDDAIVKFERYQQKIDRLEAEVESYEFTENKDLASQFKTLEQDENIEQELAQLKKHVANS
ncbi:MAG: phage shock protein PspA [Alteromonadaceae bacterium]|nr:phage shock protein PspA [Alteromonadaceae bacterium]